MPNHCSNDLYVSGPVTEVERFLEKAVTLNEEGGATLNEDFIMPYPEFYKNIDQLSQNWQKNFDDAWELAKAMNPDLDYSTFYMEYQQENPRLTDGYNSGGYNWCINNWGTKWGSYDGAKPNLTKTGNTAKLKLTFDTAWCTYGEGFMTTLSTIFPDLEIKNRWFERGMMWQGVNIFKNGVLIESKQKRYKGKRGG